MKRSNCTALEAAYSKIADARIAEAGRSKGSPKSKAIYRLTAEPGGGKHLDEAVEELSAIMRATGIEKGLVVFNGRRYQITSPSFTLEALDGWPDRGRV